MNLNNLPLLKARFGNDRNMSDLIDTLAAINKPPLSIIQTNVPFIPSTSNGGVGVATVAHALGAVPATHRVGIQVLPGLSDGGWTAGTVIDQDQVWIQSGGVYLPVIGSAADASNVYIIQLAPASSFVIFENTAAFYSLTTTSFKWAYFVYASLDYSVVYPSDPAITLQPANATVVVATLASTSFTLAAYTHTASLTYNWLVSTNSGVSWSQASGTPVSGGTYTGTTTNTLSISNITNGASSTPDMDGYLYQCVVTNAVNNSVASNQVTLSVS